MNHIKPVTKITESKSLAKYIENSLLFFRNQSLSFRFNANKNKIAETFDCIVGCLCFYCIPPKSYFQLGGFEDRV